MDDIGFSSWHFFSKRIDIQKWGATKFFFAWWVFEKYNLFPPNCQTTPKTTSAHSPSQAKRYACSLRQLSLFNPGQILILQNFHNRLGKFYRGIRRLVPLRNANVPFFSFTSRQGRCTYLPAWA
jgi:hypothetical protein